MAGSGPAKRPVGKTIVAVLILHLLKEEPDHGFGLMQRMEELCGIFLAVNANKIYPLLRDMEEQRFITGEWDHPTKRARRYYTITQAGIERLTHIRPGLTAYLEGLERTLANLRTNLSETHREVS